MPIQVLIAATLPIVAIGGWLSISALLGRSDPSEPRCRVCRRDLRDALIADLDRCPGCDASLARGTCVRFGRGRRQRGRLVIGLVGVVVPAIVIGVTLDAAARARAARQAAIAAALVGRNTAPARPIEQVLADAAAAPDSFRLWDELAARHLDGELEAVRLREALLAGAAALAPDRIDAVESMTRGDGLDTVPPGIARIIGDRGAVEPGVREAAAALLVPGLSVEPIRDGRMVRISIPRRELASAVAIVDADVALEDGTRRSVRLLRDGRRGIAAVPESFPCPLGWAPIDFIADPVLPPGAHRLEIVVDEIAGPERPLRRSRRLGRRPLPPEYWPAAVLRRTRTITIPWTVAEEGDVTDGAGT